MEYFNPVRVVIRIRRMVPSEMMSGCSSCVFVDVKNQQISINKNSQEIFKFNHVFTQINTQAQVYEIAVHDLVEKLFCGEAIVKFKVFGYSGDQFICCKIMFFFL